MIRKLLAEWMGTYALVFFGTGAIMVNRFHEGVLGHMGVCIVFGLVVMTMIYAVGDISGAHLNPAVSLGFYADGRMKFPEMLTYSAVQLLGATSASFTCSLMFGVQHGLGETVPSGGLWGAAFGMETLLTFILMFVILRVSTGSKEKGITAAIAIGGVVTMAAMVGGPVSGASMNPARSFGPALMSGNWESFWVYLAGPYLGCVMAVMLCRILHGEKTSS